MIGAGVTMCGVTRLPVTLAIILFELTGSLDYMIPFSVAIFVSKWVADAIEPSSIYVSPHILTNGRPVIAYSHTIGSCERHKLIPTPG